MRGKSLLTERVGAGRGATVSEPFIGEIKMWAFDWAPQNWALCDGSLLPVQQYNALFFAAGQ